ncbi:Tim44 domain-containing protein [Ramlibacter sp.]|uniref:Tim44 domain-containing protein n=1 Tax=Ramlibacter sp. TaxID=1917967 RepID=UPI003D1053F5
MKFWSWVLVALMALASIPDAEAARRLGGGKSVGRQSSNVTQREASPPAAAPNSPANAQQAQRPGQPGATPPAPARPWGAMLGGLAAGLGLAWLASSLGLGAGFANILMMLLLAFVAMAVIGFIMKSRRGRQGGLAYQGAGASPMDPAPLARQYNPDKVGNDASARPWERNTTSFEAAQPAHAAGGAGAAGGLGIGSGLGGSQNWGVPAGFDTEGFLSAAKRNFMTLQDAWDRSDVSTLRSMMTDDMLREIRAQLADRERESPGQPSRTEVDMLDAKLLGIEETVDDWLASVEFSGMIREEPSAGPAPFREVWNMVKPRTGGGGWLVAGVQALQ